MTILNVEFKARTVNLIEAERKLLSLKPRFVGEDLQTDSYFNVQYGRLKLREGIIENTLIHYERPDTAEAKESAVLLYQHKPDGMLKQLLTKAIGIKVVVTKTRKIYFIDNVKFHFDTIKELGDFIEVEAIDIRGEIGIERLNAQCEAYAGFFGIGPSDYVSFSYSDLMLKKSTS